jgi:amidase
MPSSFATSTDGALARGEERPLLGIPVTLKEPFNVAGLPTTWGFQKFRILCQLKMRYRLAVEAGRTAHLGKTNIPVGLREFQSYNDICGATNNPRALPVGCRSRVSQDHSQPPG